MRTDRRRSSIGWFLHHYGWRAYAIPVLVALTVLTIFQVGKENSSASAATSGSSSSSSAETSTRVSASPGTVVTTVVSGVAATVTIEKPGPVTTVQAPGGTPTTGATAPNPNGSYPNLPKSALPAGAVFAVTGKGTWHVIPGTTAPIGNGPNKYTFTVEAEDGISNPEQDQEFASAVDTTLADPRSWIGSGKYTLQRIDSGTPSFRISLTSQLTVRKSDVCGWTIPLESSCYARDLKRVAINDARWVRGAISFNGDLGSYRVYAVNHEVGHALGYVHVPCPANGGLAPVMMQQSWSTADNDLAPLNPQLIPMDGKVCLYNPYPFPRGGTTATGAAASTPKITATE